MLTGVATPPNFAEKTFANSHKTLKLAKVFSLKSFPLYSIKPLLTGHHMVSVITVYIPLNARFQVDSNTMQIFQRLKVPHLFLSSGVGRLPIRHEDDPGGHHKATDPQNAT